MTEPANTPTEGPTQSPAAPYRASGVPTPPEPSASRRRLRAMAAVRWLLLLAITALAVHSVWTTWGPSHEHRATEPDRYYCPMHPQIRSPDPGECPICHMRLEPIPRERQQPVATSTPPSDAAVTTGAGATGADAAAAPASVSGDDAGPLQGVVPVTVTLDRQQLIGVTTAPVARHTISQQLRVPGVVEVPENMVAHVHVRSAGYIERVAVRTTGVRVARGEPLAWVYSPQIYQTEQELLTAHRWAAERVPGSAAPTDAAPHVNTLQPTEVEAAARRSLELLGVDPSDIDAILRAGTPLRAVPLRAPIAGYVTRFAAVLGAYAMPETTLYEIADLSRVWVVASLYERDVSRVRPGLPARFVTPGVPGGPWSARITLIEPEVSASTRTARVRLEATNPGMALHPGQYGDVVFNLTASTTLAVPRDAVIDTGTQQYVFVDRGEGRFEPRPVRTSALVGDLLEVAEGVREGERVVVRGNFMLDSESRLQASLAETPAITTDAGVGR